MIAAYISLCLIICFVIADAIYKVKRVDWPNLIGEIGNRSGIIVSFWPFDLRVTINTENPITKNREWVTDWRWNCKFIKVEDL